MKTKVQLSEKTKQISKLLQVLILSTEKSIMVMPQRYIIALLKIFRQNQLVQFRAYISIAHHQFLPTSSLYTTPLFSRQSIALFHPFTLSVFTLGTNSCVYISNSFQHFTHTAIAPSTLPNTTHQVTEPESKQWQVCEYIQEFSEQKQGPCVHISAYKDPKGTYTSSLRAISI